MAWTTSSQSDFNAFYSEVTKVERVTNQEIQITMTQHIDYTLNVDMEIWMKVYSDEK